MLSPGIRRRLEAVLERHEELGGLLADPEVLADAERLTALSKEYAKLEPVVSAFRELGSAEADLSAAEELDLGEEAGAARALIEALNEDLRLAMVPQDPADERNAFLEIRAGAGGDEAALFAGDLFRMYLRYAESQGWQLEILSQSEGEVGGYREVICRVEGAGVYGKLKFESGAHRVQRIPATESQGRIHTSACTVAVLPEIEASGDLRIEDKDLRIDTYRASGAGGQHVNKTDSAVRITHLPSGVVVECQDERSQHKNKARALSLLQARLEDAERSARETARAEERRVLVGSGDRSERIRTYNFPQGRVTDHRINLTLHLLDRIIEGELAPVVDALVAEDRAARLALTD